MSGEHEHTFFPHADPRWLVCDCGQFAVRMKSAHGQFLVRLIDPPSPSFRANAGTVRVMGDDTVVCTDDARQPEPA